MPCCQLAEFFNLSSARRRAEVKTKIVLFCVVSFSVRLLSVFGLWHHIIRHHVYPFLQNYTDAPTGDDAASSSRNGFSASAMNVILKMFDITLLFSPTFLVICFGGVAAFVGR